MKRVTVYLLAPALSFILTMILLPVAGWTTGTTEQAVTGAVDAVRWADNLTALGGLIAGVSAMLLPVAILVLKVWRAWDTSEARREALEATIAAVEGLRNDIDKRPGVSSEAPAASVEARTKAWAVEARPRAASELRSAVWRVRWK